MTYLNIKSSNPSHNNFSATPTRIEFNTSLKYRPPKFFRTFLPKTVPTNPLIIIPNINIKYSEKLNPMKPNTKDFTKCWKVASAECVATCCIGCNFIAFTIAATKLPVAPMNIDAKLEMTPDRKTNLVGMAGIFAKTIHKIKKPTAN